MSVTVSQGMGFSTGSSTVYYTDITSSKFKPLVDVNNFASSPWSLWGDDNQEPERMKDDLENSGVLSAGVISKTRMAIGEGLYPALVVGYNPDGTEILERLQDTEIERWLETNKTYMYSYSNIYNLLGYGWAATQFILNNDRSYINRIKSTDVVTARLSKKDVATAQIADLYLCSDFSTVFNYDAKKMQKIPILQEGYELEHLQSKTSGFEFAMIHRLLTNGRQYYPRPLWKAAQSWVKISRSIPAMKEALHRNQMSIKYVILISDEYWDKTHKGFKNLDAEKKETIIKEKYAEIDKWLVGEQNTGKSIIAGSFWNPIAKEFVPDIQITVLDEKWKDGKMLPDNAAADKQILFSMFFNPAIWGGNLLGDGASGGAGSGSDIREAYLVQLMLMQAERMMNLDVFTLVKYYNGWANKYEKDGKFLVFKYKTAILTTLDTGGSTKPMNN